MKRVGASLLISAALFGVAAIGMLARHRGLRTAAVEMLKLDVHVLAGGG